MKFVYKKNGKQIYKNTTTNTTRIKKTSPVCFQIIGFPLHNMNEGIKKNKVKDNIIPIGFVWIPMGFAFCSRVYP